VPTPSSDPGRGREAPDPELFGPTLEALDRGDPEGALERLEALDPELGERWALAVHVWLELGDPDAAEEALRRAMRRLEEQHPDLLWARGQLALHRWRLDEARAIFARLDPEVEGAGLLETQALLAELAGDEAEADALFRRAARLDPEGAPLPPRLSADRFERVVAEAAAELPPEFQAALEELAVVIDPMPSAALVGAPGSGHPPDLLGLYVGPPLFERAAGSGGELPPTIFLFQRNLERAARSHEDLVEEIRTTLYHELGHALGFDEDGVDELGLG